MALDEHFAVKPVINGQTVDTGSKKGQKGKGKEIFHNLPQAWNQHGAQNKQHIDSHGQGQGNGHHGDFIVALQ